MKRVVIIGGGVGGSLVASRLGRNLGHLIDAGELEVLLVTESDRHLYQPGLLYVSLGLANPEPLSRSARSLLHRRVKLVFDTVEGVDPERCEVTGRKGNYGYDHLVVATGSVPVPELLPGLKEGGHWFYTLEGSLRLREALANFQGGRILLTVGVPHKCPVAPLEFTFLLDELLRQRGLRDKTEIYYTYPIGRVHTLEPVAAWAAEEFARRGIKYEVFFNPETVDAGAKTVTSLEGSTVPYDLLVSVPIHEGSAFLRSGLGDRDGWVPTDRYTLRARDWNNIHVLGDTTDIPISKSGSGAHYQGELVAANLEGELVGNPLERHYDGKVFCFIESGLKQATYIRFDYETPPVLQAPSELLHWFKVAYNQIYWLTPQGIL